jgi:hypothetical protein
MELKLKGSVGLEGSWSSSPWSWSGNKIEIKESVGLEWSWSGNEVEIKRISGVGVKLELKSVELEWEWS